MIIHRFFLVLVVLPFLVLPRAYSGCRTEMSWYNDFDKVSKLAQTQHKKIFIAFCTPWCRQCKKMEHRVCSNTSIINYFKKYYLPMKINAAVEKRLTTKYKIKDYPSFVFLDSKSKVILHLHGYIYSNTFKKILCFVAEEHYRKMTLEQYLEK